MKIQEALQTIFDIANIKSREDLDRWCGKEGRKRLYMAVRRIAPEHWEKLKEPECTTRARYESILSGYKIFGNKDSHL